MKVKGRILYDSRLSESELIAPPGVYECKHCASVVEYDVSPGQVETNQHGIPFSPCMTWAWCPVCSNNTSGFPNRLMVKCGWFTSWLMRLGVGKS